jgi:FixJ family two-component response regulator
MLDALGDSAIGPLLVLTPTGRDADRAAELLQREAIPFRVLRDGRALGAAIDETAGAVLVADEALVTADLTDLRRQLDAQPAWSDLPFVVLTHGGSNSRRALGELRLPEALGNVMFLERPLNALTLVSAVRTALRARRRQRQVRDHLAERAAATEELTRSREELERLVIARTVARTGDGGAKADRGRPGACPENGGGRAVDRRHRP